MQSENNGVPGSIHIASYEVIPFLVILFFSLLLSSFAFAVFSLGSWWIVRAFANRLDFEDKIRVINHISITWTVGIIFALTLYLIYYYTNGEPYYMSDDLLYDTFWSDLCVERGYFTISELNENPELKVHSSQFYVLFLAYIKRISVMLGGYHTMIPRVINISLLNLAGLVAARIATIQYGVSGQLELSIIKWVCLFPNSLYLCSHIYRDAIICAALVLAYYIWSVLKQKKAAYMFWALFTTFVIAFIIYYSRRVALVYLAAIIIVNIFDFSKGINIKTPQTLMKLLALILVVSTGLFVFSDKTEWLIYQISRYSAVWTGEAIKRGSGFYALVSDLSIGVFAEAVVKCVYYAVTPMYGQLFSIDSWKSVLDLVFAFITLGTLGSFYLYPYLIKMIPKLDNIVIVFLTVFVSTAITTAGFRHILISYPYLFVIALSGRNNTSLRIIETNRKVVTTMIAFFVIVYGFARKLI